MHLPILYQDADYVAIDKPPGLLVHRTQLDAYATEFALQTLRDQIGQEVFPCHRLDRPTSGILLFALNHERKIGAVLSKSAFKDMKTRLGPDQHAGAPLLGLRGNILKSHGSSNYVAIANALRIAKEVVTHDMIDSIGSEINQANALITKSNSENAP